MSVNAGRNIFSDIFRALLCIAVLFYHLGLLKGGYLAVCGFFVLSGYFAAASTDRKIKEGSFSLKKHFFSRLKRIYLPLAFVCFITLFVLLFFKDTVWISLKPETKSVLLGYNNFWQLNASLDYFARHTDSPFMHFWYMGILLQFELVFPFVFPVLSRKKPELVWGVIAAISIAVFIIMNAECTVMTVYYNTFSRCFSIILGIFSYFISAKKPYKIPPVLFTGLILFSFVLFITTDAASSYFAPAMILFSLLSCIITAYPVDSAKLSGKHSRKDGGIIKNIFSYIASVSYEIYLVQYPVLFFYQQINGDIDPTDSSALLFRAAFVIPLTILISVFLNYALKITDIIKDKCFRTVPVKLICGCLAIVLSLVGAVKFILEKDHTQEMKALEEQLASQQLLMEQRQEEQAKKMAEEKAAFEAKLAEFDKSEETLKELSLSVPITAIGDSVMLGASARMCEVFSSCYCDAAVSRTAYAVRPIIEKLISEGTLGNIVVFHLGTNGDGPEYLKENLMDLCKDKTVFWLSITNDKNDTVNNKLKSFTERYDNAHFIDWNLLSEDHPEYFRSDGIHLTPEGQAGYSRIIADAIYQYYLEQFNLEKDAYLKHLEYEKNSRYTLAGDELLMTLMQHEAFTEGFPSELSVCQSTESIADIAEGLKKAEENDSLTDHIVIALYGDEPQKADYEAIIRDYSGSGETERDFLFVTIKDGDDIINAAGKRVRVIDFSADIAVRPEYLHADRIHLTEEGTLALIDKILNTEN